MSTGAGTKRVLAGLLFGSSLALLVGCGVVEDTLEGLGTSGPSPSSPPPPPSMSAEGSIVVTVEIDSDATTATDLATHCSEGSGATATCERRLRLGPS